uniref:Uncharacterized protein n=1 Tax=Oryza sativa subsp. japonica TaxID=39947 RepID=Q851P8_ORYSJ|nr:hypothetical protein [Oryza sativa Japonica Group]
MKNRQTRITWVAAEMTGATGGGHFSGETAGGRAAAGAKPGANSHTGGESAPRVCQLRRVQSGRRPSKRRRIGEVPGSPDSPASLLHLDPG